MAYLFFIYNYLMCKCSMRGAIMKNNFGCNCLVYSMCDVCLVKYCKILFPNACVVEKNVLPLHRKSKGDRFLRLRFYLVR